MRDLRQHSPLSERPQSSAGLSVMFLAAFPLVLWLFQGSIFGVATAVLDILLFIIALRFIAGGQRVHNAYNLAQMAKRPKLPRKVIGSVLIGVVVFILAGYQVATPVAPIALAVSATSLSLLAFGFDPMRNKGLDNPELLNQMAAEHAWDAAEDALTQITNRVAQLADADLTFKTEAVRNMVLRLMRSFGTEPRNLARIEKLVSKLTEILRAEAEHLQADWHSDNHLFARKRFVLKLQVLSESFESHAREGSVRNGRDVFDLEADLLLDKMPLKSAA